MAYMNQEKKKELAPNIKAICKKYGVKATLAVHNYSTLVLNVKESSINFDLKGRNHIQFHHDNHNETGEASSFLNEVMAAMMNGNHNNSDAMIDYFDVGWYIEVNIGNWDKPYIFKG